MTIEQILKLTGKQINFTEAEILLAHFLKKGKIWLYKNPKYSLNTKRYTLFRKLVSRRQKNEPIAYIIKHQEFYGLDFYVDKRVLVPRPETELLVEKTLEITTISYTLNPKRFVVADIGTGSGCISIALAKKLKIINCKLKIFAADISKRALEVAKINAKKHHVLDKITFLHGDLLKPLPEKVDIIVANLPYVDKTLLKRSSEPKVAFNGGKKGLEIIKKLLKQAPKYLKPNGKILLEIDQRQKNELAKFITKYFPDTKYKFIKDLADRTRLVIISN